MECTMLKSVVLGKNTAVIGSYAFVNCTSLESVTIPSTLTKIGMGVFGRCDNLKKIYYEGSEELWRGIEISEIDNDLDSVEIVFNWGY